VTPPPHGARRRDFLALWLGRSLPLIALLAVPASATPESDVAKAFSRIHALLASEKGLDARSIAGLDKLARAEGTALEKHGWRAVAPLGAVAQDLARPMKERLLAVAFLARTGDPLASGPLAAVLADPRQDPAVRGAAAETLAGLPLSRAHARRVLDEALARPELPREALEPALAKASRVGFEKAETGRLLLRRLGARPDARGLAAARLALSGLARTHGAGAVDALLDLLGWYPADSPLRGDAVAALAEKRGDLLAVRRPEARTALEGLLRSESARPDAMVTLTRLSAEYGPELAPALARLSRHPDAEVLVEGAEALLRLKDKDSAARALPELEAVAAGALSDPRFSPLEGRPDPAGLLSRLERALGGLKVVAAAPER
jgi:hypothetical protein